MNCAANSKALPPRRLLESARSFLLSIRFRYDIRVPCARAGESVHGQSLETKSSRLIVGITGATGIIYGVRLLQILQETNVETHLVLSKWGARTLIHETLYTQQAVLDMATYHYAPQNKGAAISSGSFVTQGMVVCPCSARSLAAIAQGNGDTLVHRAADVVLKERRKLVLVVREAPLSDIHLENMLKLSRMGAVIFPPVPAFYNRPQRIEDIVDQTVMRVLDQFGINLASSQRWDGDMSPVEKSLDTANDVPKRKR
jgi:4-hydroxy-3-polyprenylbenzoate decarboxylase